MYHVLVILLHRPFVADGHLYNTFRSISIDSLLKCASAASSICSLLRAYHRAFSVRRAPYLISYATYVAATIHCRVAAKNGTTSTAYANLMTCLAVFKENQETNSAVPKAAVIIYMLMKKHGVVVDDLPRNALEVEQTARSREPHQQRLQSRPSLRVPENDTDDQGNRNESQIQEAPSIEVADGDMISPVSDWIDIDGIIQSFLQENDIGSSENFAYGNATSYQPMQNPQADRQQYPPASSHPIVPGSASFPAGPNLSSGTMPTNPTGIEIGSQWQQASWPFNLETQFLEDPLFGFNGFTTPEFPYTGK